jgi:hypothetical protein
MGREIKRVPADFDWPLYKVWQGYLMPDELDEEQCPDCDGSGYSDHARMLQDLWYGHLPFDPATTGSTPYTVDTPAIRARAERNIAHSPGFYGTGEASVVREAARLADLFNGQWGHHLNKDDVDALIAGDRLWDFTRTWTKGDGWETIEPSPAVTAEQVNLWSLDGMGHDSINCHIAIRARCEREGMPEVCGACAGHGSYEKYDGQRGEAEGWERTEPPTGDGWQEWETTSEGSPISPVFATAEELAVWMSGPDRSDRYAKDWMPYPAALQFVQAGWAPTFVGSASTGVVQGAEWVGMRDETEVVE